MRLYSIESTLLPSVTTILKETEDEESKEKLRKWQHKMDAIHGKDGAKIQSQEGKGRGKLLHQAIDEFWKWEKEEEAYDPIPKNTNDKKQWEDLGVYLFWENIESWLKMNKPNIQHWEKFVWTDKYAGTLDLICKDEIGTTTLIDFKTSKRVKMRKWLGEYWLQTAAYAIAYEKNTGERIDELELIVISPGTYQTFKEELWQPYQEQWEKRLEDFYKHHWQRIQTEQSEYEIQKK